MTPLNEYITHELDSEKLCRESIEAAIRGREEFTFLRDFKYSDGLSTDFMILKNGEPFVAVETKSDLDRPRQYTYGIRQLRCSQNEYYLQYGILSDGKSYKVIQLQNLNEIESLSSFSEVLEFLLRILTRNQEKNNVEKCVESIKGLLSQTYPNFENDIESFEFQQDEEVIKLTETDELRLFDVVVPSESGMMMVYRYTSIYTLFATIDNGSYRMNASEGMNDREDCDFLWRQIYGDSKKNSQYIKNRTWETVYLMSCVSQEKADDLTMWRLYGDDAKGVCMSFEKQDLPKGFYLRAVVYSEKNIQVLKNIVDIAEGAGLRFVFNYWELWGAFFKSLDYEVEKEVRLVYLESLASWKPKNTKKWVLTSSNLIPNKYVEFEAAPTTLFPLKLKKVIIGPECLEKEVVRSQFEKMMDESAGFKGIEVEISQKESYRTSRK